MRLGSGQICKETASTSYGHHASPCAFKPRRTCVYARQQKKRQAHLRVQSNAGTVAQEQWDRLELMSRSVSHSVLCGQQSIRCAVPIQCGLCSDSGSTRRVYVCRKLAVAVSEEDYSLAAQLSSDRQTLAEELPAVSQYTFHQLQQLQIGLETKSLPQQLSAIRALGTTPLRVRASLYLPMRTSFCQEDMLCECVGPL